MFKDRGGGKILLPIFDDCIPAETILLTFKNPGKLHVKLHVASHENSLVFCTNYDYFNVLYIIAYLAKNPPHLDDF